jgi:parallel beta-helix repeat protein
MRKKGYLAIFIWLLITVNFTVPNSVKFSNNITGQLKSASLEAHSPIMINGNTELDAFCSGNGTDGLTLETAHVIEGYEINSGGSGSAITINNTNRFLIIRNVTTVRGGSEEEDSGINLFNSEKITVTMSNIENNTNYGIWMLNSQNINITGNYFMNNSYGIYLDNASNNFMSNNTVVNHDASAISLDSSDKNTIIGNNVSYNSESGIYLYTASDNNISNNEISHNYEGIYIDLGENNTINGNNASYHADFGIKVERVENSTIIGNNASYNWGIGINLYEESHNNNISNNIATFNGGSGIDVELTENNTIIGNNVSYNTGYGINVEKSNNIDIIGNWIAGNDYGIYLWGGASGGNNNTIVGNTISDNNYDGIELDDQCNDNTITDNNISNNAVYGLYVTDRSNRNTISRNNFNGNSDGHIYVDRTSDNLTISNNIMNNTGSDSVYLDNSSFSSVYNNTFFDCSTGVSNYDGIHLNISSNYIEYVETGISLGDSNYSIVKNNIITLAESGIYVDGSNHFLILSNTLTKLTATGIEISSAINGSVVGNFIAHNEYGFTSFNELVNITVWLNYFYNHSYSEAKNYSSGVSFDNGTMGNYWGDYVSRYPGSVSSDGVIWDTQYGVNGTNHNDSYPLVSPGIPLVAPSNNLTYWSGASGNLISWNIVDPSILTPSFSVFRNNILNRTGVWNSGIPIEVDVDGLEVGNYTFSIEVSDGTAWGVKRSEIMVTVLVLPAPIIKIMNQTITSETINITWGEVSGAESYNIYVNDEINETTTNTFQIINLLTNGNYTITVTAVNGSIESEHSSAIMIIVEIDEVIPPNDLDGVYISIVVAFAVGFLFLLSRKRQRVE